MKTDLLVASLIIFSALWAVIETFEAVYTDRENELLAPVKFCVSESGHKRVACIGDERNE